MPQSRIASAIEAVCNVASGFILAMILWRLVVAPYLGIPVSLNQNIKVTGLFTVVSIVRGYLWRRIFNGQWRKNATD